MENLDDIVRKQVCSGQLFIAWVHRYIYIYKMVVYIRDSKEKKKTKYFQHDAVPMYFMPVECIHFRLSLRKGKLFLIYFAGLSTLQALR